MQENKVLLVLMVYRNSLKNVHETKVSCTLSCKTPMMGDSITQKLMKICKFIGTRIKDLTPDFQTKRS
jgi:hypothetical protein